MPRKTVMVCGRCGKDTDEKRLRSVRVLAALAPAEPTDDGAGSGFTLGSDKKHVMVEYEDVCLRCYTAFKNLIEGFTSCVTFIPDAKFAEQRDAERAAMDEQMRIYAERGAAEDDWRKAIAACREPGESEEAPVPGCTCSYDDSEEMTRHASLCPLAKEESAFSVTVASWTRRALKSEDALATADKRIAAALEAYHEFGGAPGAAHRMSLLLEGNKLQGER